MSDSNRRLQPYVRGNLWQDWGAQAMTIFGGGNGGAPLIGQANRLEFAGGVTRKATRAPSFYAQAGYQFKVGGSDDTNRNGVTGDFGLRLVW